MFIAGVGLTGELTDHVSTMVACTLSEDRGSLVTIVDALASSNITGASWTMSCLIFEVTTGASGAEIKAKSCATVTSSVGFDMRVPSTRVLIALSLAPRLTVKSVVRVDAESTPRGGVNRCKANL